ncbi:IucA/IucC family protein [Neorhizobium galegae]|uniref:IucA/IucC family protein n=1 Tax=Neorhizobium galegae TaxID=399 RepID=UPI0006214BA1|nr:IucA/IucC family protein [Neorhizobium galegae]KAB1122947.1 IucA/IucC family siderophore biosynthesis protein [Neorhizobium galegae]MCQ1807599.1 IucA/IucC family siderophore biosynthesis protein [Neorhizobium galegae]CDZ56893.1 Petrobactin biosynthesis protein AsbA [Neorhizobium galegae bv. orientalis]CDZ62387.1 Petrobactin biosynthesis protein AsbA [Neorhizobium galegae bv. orientalis]
MQSSRQTAEAATFQSFANCYLREVSSGTRIVHRSISGAVDAIEWPLPQQQILLRAEIVSASVCGPQHFGRLWTRAAPDMSWRTVEPMSALHLLLQEAYRQMGDARTDALRSFELELLVRVLDSYQQMTLYLEKASPAPPDEGHFIEAEQSLAFGHWQHPTPKSRQGMTFWQQERYAPELRGQFQLQYFAAKTEHVREASARTMQAHEIIRSELGASGADPGIDPDECLIPMHPLQAEALLLDPSIQAMQRDGRLRHLGPAGTLFTATSSVRTVYSPHSDWMLKFSLPVRITNSVRINRRPELEAGVAMAKLIEGIGFAERSKNFRIIQDPAYITLDIPGREESGFEVILRENPFKGTRAQGVVTVAALTADPLPGDLSRLERTIRKLAARGGDGISNTSLAWFRRYLGCAVEPLIRLYDDYGVALEAHQQNTLLDIGMGYPTASYYRDNQGFYLSERYRSLLAGYAPETETIASLYFADAEIRDRFAYYLIVNQVFSVISRMGHDGLCDEAVLLFALRAHLEHCAETMSGAGRDFGRHVLDLPTITSKANLTTRLFDVDELQSSGGHSLYRPIPNPLRVPIALAAPRTGHAIAS